jgi:hypothetical protein
MFCKEPVADYSMSICHRIRHAGHRLSCWDVSTVAPLLIGQVLGHGLGFFECRCVHPFLRFGFRPFSKIGFTTVREIFRAAIVHLASLSRWCRPPSGAASPSDADLQLTNRVAAAAQILQIHFLDHIITFRARALSRSVVEFPQNCLNAAVALCVGTCSSHRLLVFRGKAGVRRSFRDSFEQVLGIPNLFRQ